MTKQRNLKRKVQFEENAFNEYSEWASESPETFTRIHELIKECLRNPFKGTGKPEPLKFELKGYWSRRITKEHRLVYSVTDEHIFIIACKYHYKEK